MKALTIRFLQALVIALLLLACSILAHAGTVSGKITSANTGIPLANGTLNFTLTQPAILASTSAVTTQAVSCWTDSSGNIVGLPGSLAVQTPILSSNLASGTLGSGTYFVKFTWFNATGESEPSREASLALGASGTLIMAQPLPVPPLATRLNVYIGTSSGTETLQGFVAVTNGVLASSYSQASSLIAGAALPSSNTTSCQFAFNDTLIPTSTGYLVNLLNVNASQVAGYPQKWFLGGGSVNVSNGTPLYSGVVQFPNPVVTAPTNQALQSINGSLAVTGSLIAKQFDHRVMCDQEPGATLDVQIANCQADAVANGSFMMDASQIAGNKTIAAEIDIGRAAQDWPIVIYLPATGAWSSTINDNTKCAIKQFGGTQIYGLNRTGLGNFAFDTSSGALRSVYCSDLSPANGGSYVTVKGFDIRDTARVVSASGALFEANKLFDGSEVSDISIGLGFAGRGFWAYNLCCGTTVSRIVSDGGAISGAVPCTFSSVAGNVTTALGVYSISCVHPGSGKNSLFIDGSTASIFGLFIHNFYTEEISNSDTTTPYIQITGANVQNVKIDGAVMGSQVDSGTRNVVDIASSVPATSSIDVSGILTNAASQGLVNDHAAGFSLTGTGTLTGYSAGTSVFTNTLAGAYNSYTRSDRTGIVANSDFEGTSAIPTPGWATLGSTTISYETSSPAPSKLQSLKVATTAQNGGVASTNIYSVVPGETYALLAMAKTDGTGTASAQINWADKNGGFLSTSNVTTSSNSWTQLTLNNATVPASAVEARIVLQNTAAAQPSVVWFDQINLVHTSIPAQRIGASGSLVTLHQKIQNATTGSINGTTRTEILFNWPNTMVDTNYAVACSMQDSTTAAGSQGLTLERVRTKSATQVGLVINNPTGGAITGSVDCLGDHQ